MVFLRSIGKCSGNMVFQRKMKKWFMGAFLLIVLMDPAMGPEQEIVMEKTEIIPRNKQEYSEYTKNINCSKGTYPQYAVSSSTIYNETYIVCWKEITIFGFCVEFNFGGNVLQPSNLVDCTKFCVSPCNSSYSSIDSYMVLECFEKYGGVPSLEQQKVINASKELESIRREKNYELQAKQSQLCIVAVFLGMSLCANMGFILEKIIRFLRNCCTKKTGNEKTTRKEEKDQNEETKNEESGFREKLIEEPFNNDVQATSSAVPVSDETVITVEENTDPARDFYDKRAIPPISAKFMNAAFDKSQ